MSVAHYFDTMDYGPAPESDTEARAWLARHDKGFGHFIGGAWVNGKRISTRSSRRPARCWRGSRKDRRRMSTAAVNAARKAQAGWARLGGHGTRAPSLCAGAHDPAPCPPVRRGRKPRQRQADPRDARSRRAAGGPAFLSSCRLGRSCRKRNSPTISRWASSARSFRGISRS